MNASATDLLLWLVPSTLVTGTVKRLDTNVRATRITKVTSPLQPKKGRRSVDIRPVSRIAAAVTDTPDKSKRLFQLSFGMIFRYPKIKEIRRGIGCQGINETSTVGN